ncbi:Hypothetical predicted protein [Podarcis lilfordi]|nr:Hypothetical predicted protein [Podarcis lilfordi]
MDADADGINVSVEVEPGRTWNLSIPRRLLGISHCVTDSHALNDKLALKCRWLTLQLMLHKLSTEAA